jgi:pilus assembly protein CpaD
MAHSHPSPAAGLRKAILRACLLGGTAVALAGCYGPPKPLVLYPDDYRERHPITLREGERTVEVFVGRGRGGLNPAQRADVAAFAATWKHKGNSGIVIDVPRGGATKQAAADSLREIHSILSASGVPPRGLRVRSYIASDLAAPSIKLSYTELSAHAGPCGLWPDDLGPGDLRLYQQNRAYWNLGCANQRNLAAMVDNPADLVQPRGEAAAYAARRSVALDKYRKGENPSGTYPSDATNSYDNAKLSDVGK